MRTAWFVSSDDIGAFDTYEADRYSLVVVSNPDGGFRFSSIRRVASFPYSSEEKKSGLAVEIVQAGRTGDTIIEALHLFTNDVARKMVLKRQRVLNGSHICDYIDPITEQTRGGVPIIPTSNNIATGGPVEGENETLAQWVRDNVGVVEKGTWNILLGQFTEESAALKPGEHAKWASIQIDLPTDLPPVSTLVEEYFEVCKCEKCKLLEQS